MDNSQILLETKPVSEIQGTFYVPSYQRGYRWGKEEVTRLLQDIYVNGANNYCLQPIVLKKKEDKYEVIDGQQRLTTLFILLSYIKKEFKPRIEVKFNIVYETRENSAEYLLDINKEQADTNIDFYHMYNAYREIDEWFNLQEDCVVAADDIYGYLVKYVKVIWYEVDDEEDAISLFTRLNIGKIPLTSAELVKAIFLSGEGKKKTGKEKQEEISLQWDNMEKELHNDSLWYFLTNRTNMRYQTRIDLILDLVAEKTDENREKYYTFFKIDEKSNTMTLDELWRKIQQTFLLLKDWYENHELYHKIGYLIASEEMTLQQLYKLSEGKTKKEFRDSLDSYIRKSISIQGNYADLSYDKSQDYKRISTLLLLFNVESVRLNGENTQWFPFDKFKFDEKGNVAWSLEHIHAQHSDGLNTQELWKEWLNLHIPSVMAVTHDEELIGAMKEAVEKTNLERKEFDELQQKVTGLLSVQGNTEYLHTIGNMALLRSDDNSALNNSTFDVKRNRIVDLDKEGQYIPFCTKMVFLKYYTPSENNQLHFWGQADRNAYITAINKILAPYLEEPILMTEEA